VIHKRGDTLTWNCTYKDSAGVPINLTGYTVRAQIRDATEVQLVALTYTAANQGTSPGQFTLSATAAVTAAWAPGQYRCDIEYTDGSSTVRSTDAFIVEVVKDITQ
jgi:hypothetical protein